MIAAYVLCVSGGCQYHSSDLGGLIQTYHAFIEKVGVSPAPGRPPKIRATAADHNGKGTSHLDLKKNNWIVACNSNWHQSWEHDNYLFSLNTRDRRLFFSNIGTT